MTGGTHMNTINEVPILLRREIEALMVAPFLNAFAKELGWDRTREIAQSVIASLALQAGKDMAVAAGGNTLNHLLRALSAFSQGSALTLEERDSNAKCVRTDVTRCAYAEMYRRNNLTELGSLLSCQRDNYLFEGFNPDLVFTRTKTIMDGCDCCDFCMEIKGEK
jgi:hypothetical protein